MDPPTVKAPSRITNHIIMKSSITALCIAALTSIGATTPADARPYPSHTYVSSYLSCGTPIYTERYLVGYDRCGEPVWGHRTVRSPYRPVVRSYYQSPCPPPTHHGHAGYYSHSSRYNHRTYGHHNGYRRGYSSNRVTIHGSICR
jgi:hypothetical protein